eukprot:6265089-Pyramimonas_sp.AAC.1
MEAVGSSSPTTSSPTAITGKTCEGGTRRGGELRTVLTTRPLRALTKPLYHWRVELSGPEIVSCRRRTPSERFQAWPVTAPR